MGRGLGDWDADADVGMLGHGTQGRGTTGCRDAGMWDSGTQGHVEVGLGTRDSGTWGHGNCNKLQLIIGHGTHITDISKPTFNDYQDGSPLEHEVQLKSTMGNLVREA